jgi:hypothetical protein
VWSRVLEKLIVVQLVTELEKIDSCSSGTSLAVRELSRVNNDII